MHDVAGGRSGGLGGEHRSLSPVSSPSTPPAVLPQPPIDPQRSLTLLVTPFAFVLSFLLSRPFSTSLYPPFSLRQPTPVRIYSLSFLVPSLFIARPLFRPFRPLVRPWRQFLFSRSLFLLLFASFSFSLCASCERTIQPNNRHRRRKPENSVTSPLSLSLSHSLLFFVCLRLFVRHGDYLSPYSAARKKLDFAIPMAARENLFEKRTEMHRELPFQPASSSSSLVYREFNRTVTYMADADDSPDYKSSEHIDDFPQK